MAKPNDGGPAFPTLQWAWRDGKPIQYTTDGMTSRQWFAGQALQGMCNGIQITPSKYEQQIENMADWSYLIADAMIARLEGDK